MKCSANAYEGNDAYAYWVASTEDAYIAGPLIERLASKGLRIWYASQNGEWGEKNKERFMGCSVCIVLLSANSAGEHGCREKLTNAVWLKKPIVVIQLGQPPLSCAMKLQMERCAVVCSGDMPDDSLTDKILQSNALQGCKGAPDGNVAIHPYTRQPQKPSMKFVDFTGNEKQAGDEGENQASRHDAMQWEKWNLGNGAEWMNDAERTVVLYDKESFFANQKRFEETRNGASVKALMNKADEQPSALSQQTPDIADGQGPEESEQPKDSDGSAVVDAEAGKKRRRSPLKMRRHPKQTGMDSAEHSGISEEDDAEKTVRTWMSGVFASELDSAFGFDSEGEETVRSDSMYQRGYSGESTVTSDTFRPPLIISLVTGEMQYGMQGETSVGRRKVIEGHMENADVSFADECSLLSRRHFSIVNIVDMNYRAVTAIHQNGVSVNGYHDLSEGESLPIEEMTVVRIPKRKLLNHSNQPDKRTAFLVVFGQMAEVLQYATTIAFLESAETGEIRCFYDTFEMGKRYPWESGAMDSATISHQHATLTAEDGQWTLTDHSRNGTFVNGHYLHNADCALKAGDVIKIEGNAKSHIKTESFIFGCVQLKKEEEEC